ncbi:ahpC/TSA family protein [Spiroplasma sabaudiense Ar-1343]|uniref:Bacterioferritin comigratory protein n=1 Tax=Spiroplasma sabaudiense Ar-1343 TaxID=1276257 RepID=W6AKN1_9MOLU|nr:peroxiredoxin [Spiroplasma sabaudiense]AHI54279.1 ahpC/TSA family protein [Spiroplasma sabaudiense Ar-1343]
MEWKSKNYLLEDGSKKMLGQMVGPKGIILFFYPKASTTFCTLEVNCFQENLSEIKSKGYSVAGVSMDHKTEQEKFAKECNIDYSLICDTDLILHKGFNTINGETPTEEDRSTFILDKNLDMIHEFRNIDAVEHIKEVIGKL